jgi:alkylhydroperoxidase family enzyme
MAARLPYVEREQATPDVQQLYDRLHKATGRVLNFYKLLAHHARSLPRFVEWYPTLREGPLDLKLRQLAYVKVAQLNRCQY